jgi:hypothetical protein
MKNANRLFGLSIVALSLLSGAAYADSGKTLAQSQAEYIAARDSGNLPTGFLAKSPREVFAANPVAASQPQGRVVAATLVDEGAVPLGFSGHTARELFPGNYAAAQDSTVTRAQVRAGYVAASKAGELPIGFAAVPAKLFYPVSQESVDVASHPAATMTVVPTR